MRAVFMKNKVCLVTGMTAGIGKVTARELAKMGATVVGLARDEARGKAAVADIAREAGSDKVTLLVGDLASQASVRAAAERFKATHDRLDVLVNNAGAILGERSVTEDGVEATFAANHLGPFLLTHLLLDVITASAPSRIVNVSSAVHNQGRIPFDDWKAERRWSSFDAYADSKLANILFTKALAKRLNGKRVTVNALHPGVIASNFGQSGNWFFRIGTRLVAPLLTSPDRGADTTLYLASSPEVEGVTGKYFAKKREKTPSKAAQDEALAERLWEASAALTGV